MDFFGGDDPSSNPFEVINAWLDFAHAQGEVEPTAVNLATVDAQGMPNVRVVFIREFEENGLVFYTNYEGKKAQELSSGMCAVNFYFPKLERQIRLRGRVEKVSNAQSDAYFLSRSEGSRLGAWVSKQSQVLGSRETMMQAWHEIDPAKANVRPDNWGGFRLIAQEIEFWAMGEFRLHDRFRWTRENLDAQDWRIDRLYP